MEEIKNEIEEEENQRWITILLIIGNLIVWTVIMLFISIAKVDAASLDYDNTSNYIHKTNGTAEWIQFPRASEYNLNTLNTYDQINLQWTNYQNGVANGVARFEINSISLLSLTCNQLYNSIRIQENGNTIQVPLQKLSCIRDTSSNYVLVEVGFVTSLIGTNSYFEVQFRNNIQLASKVRAYGVMTVNSIDPATNTDIQDQTNALINNNNSNTQIITNAVENSTTNIINQMQDNLRVCIEKELNNNNIEKSISDKYLNENGEERANNGWNISDFYRIQQNKSYTISSIGIAPSYCLYDNNKNQISCTNYNGIGTLTFNSSNAVYVRISYNNTDNTFYFKGNICQDRTQAEIEELKVLQNLMHTTPWEDIEPDSNEFEITHEMENDILDMADDIDLDDVDVDLDTESSNWVWTTLTTLLNTHEKVFGMVISILSVGVIKLLLNR